MNIVSRYVDENGNIKNILYKVNHNIINQYQIDIVEKQIINELKNSIIILRGISDQTEIVYKPSVFKSNQYEFKNSTPFLNFAEFAEPAFGSANECLNNNLSLMAQKECYKVQSFFDNIKIKLIPLDIQIDSIILHLSEIRSTGIYSHLYEVKFIFNENYSSTCQECQNGMLHLRQEFDKISNQLYIDKNNTDIQYSGKIISDLSINNKTILRDELMTIFENSLKLSRIKHIEINEFN